MPRHAIDLSWNAEWEHYIWTLESGAEIIAKGEDPGAYMDPEEAFCASLASCHMLSFVTEAAREGFAVSTYEDKPIATLGKNRKGKLCVTTVALGPSATFSGDQQPSDDEVIALHKKAREKCIISNSLITDITVDPQL